MQLEDWSEAKASLEMALKAHVEDAKTWFNLALVYQALDETVLMKKALQEVLRLQPDHAQAKQLLDT